MSQPPDPPRDDPQQSRPGPADSLSPTVAGSGSGAPPVGPGAAAGAGHRFGDFEIVGEIGRGGMGVVYEARQISLNRPVALKVLPSGLGMTADSVRRFEREAQTAARLHHTNIVPVFAIGSEQGSYFYAMELVDGQPLNDVIQSMRGGAPSPLMERTVTQVSASLGGAPDRAEPKPGATSTISDSASGGGTRVWFDTVAKLMADVADALHYAHGRGVIHRDIKPGNLMLSSDGRLCLMDFGLARAIEEPGMTVTGSFMGTPAYMSPEQIAAGRIRVDERSDIYSLGAVLYELLTFQRPFPGESRDEILTAIMTRDPAAPRRANPRIPQDLETICLKAMEKDPARRYPTAAAMADDLRRFLHRGLITARRASLARRAGRWVQRHPVQVTVAVAAVVLVAGIFGVTGVLSAQKARESALRALADARYYLSEGQYPEGLAAVDEALAKAPELEEARLLKARLLIRTGRAAEAVTEARRVIDASPRDWTAHLVMAMAASDPLSGAGLPTIDVQEHLKVVEEEAPETADAYYARALASHSDREALRLLDRALEIEPAHADAITERVYRHEALKNYASAIADAERLTLLKPRSAKGRQLVGWIHGLRHDDPKALEAFESAQRMDPDDPILYRLRAQVFMRGSEPANALADYDRAVALDSTHVPTIVERAMARNAMGDYDGALADARRAAARQPEQTGAYGAMYVALRGLGRTAEMSQLMDQARGATADWKNERARGEFFSRIAMGEMETGRLDAALAYADTGVMLRPDWPTGYAYRAFIKRLRGNMIGAEEDCARCANLELTEPEKLFERAAELNNMCGRRDLAIRDLAFAIEMAPEWAELYAQRALYHRNERDYDASIADYTMAIELAPAWHTMYNNRAVNYSRMGRHEQAIADFSRAIELGSGSSLPYYNKATALARLGRIDEAFAAIEESRPLEPNRGIVDERRARLLLQLGRVDEALKAADAAIAVEPDNASYHLTRASILAHAPGQCGAALGEVVRARSLAPRNDFSIGIGATFLHLDVLSQTCPEGYQQSAAYEQALEMLKIAPNDAGLHVLAGIAYYRNGRLADAARMLGTGLERAEGLPDAKTLFYLAMTQARAGRAADARGTYRRAVEAMQRDFPDDPVQRLLHAEATRVLGVS